MISLRNDPIVYALEPGYDYLSWRLADCMAYNITEHNYNHRPVQSLLYVGKSTEDKLLHRVMHCLQRRLIDADCAPVQVVVALSQRTSIKGVNEIAKYNVPFVLHFSKPDTIWSEALDLGFTIENIITEFNCSCYGRDVMEDVFCMIKERTTFRTLYGSIETIFPRSYKKEFNRKEERILALQELLPKSHFKAMLEHNSKLIDDRYRVHMKDLNEQAAGSGFRKPEILDQIESTTAFVVACDGK